MQGQERTAVRRYENGLFLSTSDAVAAETVLTIKVNGISLARTMCTPSNLRELALGYLLSAGVLDPLSQLEQVVLDEKSISVDVIGAGLGTGESQTEVRTSGCGMGQMYLEVLSSIKRNDSTLQVRAETVLAAVSALAEGSALFRQTGGVHSAALLLGDELALFYDDIGRHNAVDKVLGGAFLKGYELGQSALVLSGRISSEMVLKAGRMGVPAVISRSAPTSLALDLGRRLGITLVGFARGRRMNIYTCPERILG